MKMSPLKYSTTVICAVFIAIGAASGEEEKVFGEVGGTVSFGPDSISPPISSIIWKQKKNADVVKAIEWDAEDGESIPNQRFQGITTLNKETGKINITNLNPSHIGVYTIDINSKEQEQKFKLEVLPLLPKPVIKIEKIQINPNAVYLICEYNERIIWKNATGEILKGSPHTPRGEFTTVEKKGNPDLFYTCTLKNKVSESTSDPVYERDLFEESVPWWIFIIVLILILFLVAVLCVLLYKFWPWFHAFVSSNFEETPCIGAILNCLDGKKKDEDKQLEEGSANRNSEGKKEDENSPNDMLLTESKKKTQSSSET